MTDNDWLWAYFVLNTPARRFVLFIGTLRCTVTKLTEPAELPVALGGKSGHVCGGDSNGGRLSGAARKAARSIACFIKPSLKKDETMDVKRSELAEGTRVWTIRMLAAAALVVPFSASADEPARGATAAPGTMLAQAGAPAKSMASVQVELDALIKAAKTEGVLTVYSAATENVIRRVADAFTAKYGIKVQFSRFAAAALMQRYSAEAEANSFAADLIFSAGGAQAFAEQGVKRGWLESVSEAGIPAMKSGEYPAQFNRGASAIVQVAPWMVAYNMEKLKGPDVPKDWPDLLKPHLKGQILLPNPASALAYLDFWVLALEKYGPEFFARLRAQNPRQYSSGVPAVQALGAGEGMIELPAVPAQVEAIRGKGAPLGTSTIELTSGVEMQVLLTARNKSKSPNAARLMAHYVMTKEGNTVFNDDPGGMTIYDTSKLPKQYVAPKPGTAARAAEIAKLLGF